MSASRFRAFRWIVVALWFAAAAMWLLLDFPYILIGAVVIHLIEIPSAGVPIGRRNGVPIRRAAFMTLVFGFVWWWPLRRRRGPGGTSRRGPGGA